MDKFNAAPKKLHYITITSFLFGISFCLPHGIVTGEVAPALGLIPLGIGALLALYRSSPFQSRNKKKNAAGGKYQILLAEEEGEHNNKSGELTRQRVVLALLDFGCFGGLIVTVVFSILFNNGVRCRHTYGSNMYAGVRHSYSYARCKSMQPMLAAWATMVMLVNA